SVEPPAVIDHDAHKALLGTALGIAVAAHAASEFTAHDAGDGERHLVDAGPRFVVVLDLDTVVGMDAGAVRNVQVVMAETVIVGDDVYPGERRILDLPSETFPGVGRGVRLPSI